MASTARLEELKKKFDENPRRYFAPLANEHRKSGDLDQAISLCRAHLPQQPAHISGHIVLAQALFEADQLDESRAIFQAALELDAENLIGLRYLGDIARTNGDVPTARLWYQRVLEVDPRNDEIIQLVRELDAPRAPITLDAPASPAAADSSAQPVQGTTPVSRAASAEESDARFAPLSLEQIDVAGELLDASRQGANGETHDAASDISSGAMRDSDEAAEAPPELTFDVHSAWSADSGSVELPLLDTPELDPFEMGASGTAESLFDSGSDSAGTDLLMRELEGGGLHAEPESLPTPLEEETGEAWPSVAEAPAEPELIESAAGGVQALEEVDFYPEVTEPSSATAPSDDSTDAAVRADVAPVAEPELLDADERALAEYATQSTDSDAATYASADDGLGLEVMEFVPPGANAAASVDRTADMESDPLLGYTPELAPPESGATPAAFVTETMAELYLQQGFRNEALSVYRELLTRNPEDASLRERVEQIESGSMSSLGMATLSEDIVESALKRQSARPARSVRSFFASLASRRAPYRQPADPGVVESWDATPADASYEVPDGGAPLSPDMPAEGVADSGPAAAVPSLMADFDPFAMDAITPALHPPTEPTAPAWSAAPNADAAVQGREEIERADPKPVRSLDELFPDAPAAPRAEAAAQTLATAFGRTEPQGRPTRAASSELSLDNVFRGAPEDTPAPDAGFSFDQFFSDSRTVGSEVAAAPTTSPPGTGRSGSGDTNDIEQFTAWLEGLKKK